MVSVTGRQSAFPRVGFIGLGVMGAPMARNILRAEGVQDAGLTITARRRESVAELLDSGARWAASSREVAAASDVILLMLPDLPQLESVLAGPDGLLAGVEGPVILCIGSTSSPDGVREVGARLSEKTAGLVTVLDTPVSGGEDGAIAGTLSVMVGGSPADFEVARPVLAAVGNPVLLGPLGAGEVAKACNQMIVAATVLAWGEACVIAERSGLDVGALLELLSGGYAGSRVLETRRSRFVNKDYRPSGAARYMVKDLGFAMDEARKSGTVAHQLETLKASFESLTAAGFGDQDIAVTRAWVESLSGEGEG
ncbi:NAD(P)-dependent oxidoreductase [Galbitalea soli]|uniref:NAD(P)-dependent oxidoreductase n=1 Tax=Galbitalea soli TaxID=1268042 RepID=A0A7C9TQH4_9MICO|nr:NAD(P)-dependent oxidoreductase [Galbitalea soli]NEM90941.1 NAD(P)-dependent oxidoreductase [Galbitalea soli]NYJ29627.1 2-hydroxy-3-oxopropionate reductase [Galbitalea soli]